MELQIYSNPAQNLLDIHAERSNIHLLIASWCHICLQYSHDVIGKPNIHWIVGS